MQAAPARETQGSSAGLSGSKKMGVGWVTSQLTKREKTVGFAAIAMGSEGSGLESHSTLMSPEYWQITTLETLKILDEEPFLTWMERVSVLSDAASEDRLKV